MQLEAVLKAFDYMPDRPADRISGALSAMVLLGQKQVALRVLATAWEKREVGPGTATWVLGQILRTDSDSDAPDREYLDPSAVDEASTLLLIHARGLTAPSPAGAYSFPGDMDEKWHRTLSPEVKDNVLKASVYVLLSRDRSWWSSGGKMPYFPTRVWLDCIARDFDPAIRSSAAVLLRALRNCFPDVEVADAPGLAQKVDAALRSKKALAHEEEVPQKYKDLANEISTKFSVGQVSDAVSLEQVIAGITKQ